MSLAGSAVAVMLPVDDLDRSMKFYVEKLGLDHTGTDPDGGAMFSLAGGTTLVLLPRPGASRADSTAMSWQVDDVASAVKQLEQDGVTFEDYDLPGLKTVDHIATSDGMRAAWFCDPDGNVLCVHEPTG